MDHLIEIVDKAREDAGIKTMAQLEREIILNAIRIHDGNIVKAATALGVGKSTVYRKLREYEEGR